MWCSWGRTSGVRDPARIDRILRKLRVIWKAFPDERLGQIVFNLQYGRGLLQMVEDDVIERRLDEAIERGISAVDRLAGLEDRWPDG
jgi:hypothetical protein